MKQTSVSNIIRAAQADVLARRLDGGYLRIYAGAQPKDVDTPLDGQAPLAELRFADVSAPPAVAGRLVFNPLRPDSDAAGDDRARAGWFRAFASDGAVAVLDGSVGKKGSGSNLELADTRIAPGAQVFVTEFIHAVTN
jgi:hypothetical protein